VSVLIFLSALSVGINDAMIKNSVGLFPGHISGFNLPVSFQKNNLITKDVAAVLQRMVCPGIIESQNNFETVTLLAVNPEEEKKNTALWKKTVQGRYLEQGKNEIYLSLAAAKNLNVQLGDSINFRKNLKSDPITLTVSGVYKTGIDRLDQKFAFSPIGISGIHSEVWNAAIFLKNGSSTEPVIIKYNSFQTGKGQFRPWEELMPDLKQLIELNYVSMSIVMALVFGVVSIGIACTFVIFILKNLKEYGILKSMGITPGETALLIFSKVILMNLIASCIGILAGIAVVLAFTKTGIDLSSFTSYNQYFVVSGIIYPRLTIYSLCLPPALAIIFSLLAAIWPTAIVIRGNIADIIRSV
jgi:ABC-type lipoprotein release transport system permease subunit